MKRKEGLLFRGGSDRNTIKGSVLKVSLKNKQALVISVGGVPGTAHSTCKGNWHGI
jgi:hypothetical protein